MELLNIKNLHTIAQDDPNKKILKGLDLVINEGETHVIMGPNGSGKSTLANTIFNSYRYIKTDGTIKFLGEDITNESTTEIAKKGIFMSFQAPVEIPGVSMTNFMKAAVNARRQAMGKEPLKASDFIKLMKEKRQLVEIDQKLLKRSVNEGFSGGEKKRNEIFQMAMLEPTFCILDETDSGLDVDALRIVATGFNTLRTPETSAMIITHYQRLLDYIKPDVVHVLIDGKIVMTGDADLAEKIENEGFDFIVKSL